MLKIAEIMRINAQTKSIFGVHKRNYGIEISESFMWLLSNPKYRKKTGRLHRMQNVVNLSFILRRK